MCKSPLHEFLHALPKCEHHVHLEGCLSPALLFSLSAKHNVSLPSRPEYTSVEILLERYNRGFTDLQEFLDAYYLALSVLIDAEDFEMLAWEYMINAHRDGVRHVEAFFDPQSHTARGVQIEVVMEGFRRAEARANREFGSGEDGRDRLTVKLIMCFLRHLPGSAAVETLQNAVESGVFKSGASSEEVEGQGTGRFVVGVGLDSSELHFPPELFAESYSQAASLGLRLTAHAGEEGPPSYIRQALNVLGVERIDHGRRLPEDPALMAEVAEKKILLTLCPLSNVALKGVEKISELPIRTLLDAGVQFSINSDDPAYFGGYILNNYCAVQEGFDLSVAEWRTIAHAAINGSWVTEDRRKELSGLVEDCVARYV